MTDPKFTASIIEIAIHNYFDVIRNLTIPNVRWGFRGISYEIDLMVVTYCRFAYDIEIKVSASDLKRDQKKHKWDIQNRQHYFRKHYFAIPEKLLKYSEFIPDYAGILTVSYNEKTQRYFARENRPAKIDALAKKITDDEIIQLGRLCMFRMWGMKSKIERMKKCEVKNE